jgi:hypothetical protein
LPSGSIGNNIASLSSNARSVGEIGGLSNGRIPTTNAPLETSSFSSLTRGFGAPGNAAPGQGNQFGGLGGGKLGGIDDDANENEDFPALPSSSQLHPGLKHDGGSHLGSMLGGNNFGSESMGSASLFSPTTGSMSAPGSSVGSSLLDRTTRSSHLGSSLYPGTAQGSGLIGGLGGQSLDSGNLSNTSSLSNVTTPSLGGVSAGGGVPGGLLGNLGLPSSIGSGSGSSALNKDNRFGMAGLLEIIRSTEKVSFFLFSYFFWYLFTFRTHIS